MKIRIEADGRKIRIGIPTGLIFSKPSVWLYMKLVRRFTSLAWNYIPEHAKEATGNFMENLSDDAVYAICEELRRIKRKHGSWELVDVESSDGSVVKITL